MRIRHGCSQYIHKIYLRLHHSMDRFVGLRRFVEPSSDQGHIPLSEVGGLLLGRDTELDQKRVFQRGLKDGILEVQRYYDSIASTKDRKKQIELIIKEIKLKLPKQPLRDPEKMEHVKELRQCLHVLERLQNEEDLGTLAKRYAEETNNRYHQCLLDFSHWGEIIRQELEIVRKLES